jgi:Vacuolar protein sorting-associated protein 62
MGDHDDLLRRFQPVLRYDSNEQFFADSAEQYMVNPGCELRRAPAKAGGGAVLASAVPTGQQPQLALAFLDPETYGDGTPVEKGDVLSVKGKDYRAQYRRLRVAHPELNNVVYGHAVEANGRVWLQYWLWYFYNDYQLSFALGTHEGDWEMVQFRMDDDAGQPDIAVYAQHRYGEMRPWDDVEKFPGDPDRAIVYVARGSHASYFEAGFHQTEAWYDLADGKRRMNHKPALEILEHDEPAWVRWPGHWGDTVAASGGISGAVTSNSPDGPGVKKQWLDPDRLLDNPPGVVQRGKAPAAPDVLAKRQGGRLRIEYDVTKRDPRPSKLVVTVNSIDDARPPHAHTLDVHASGHGKVTTDIVLDPLKHYDVSTSVVAGDPPIPSESTVTEIAPFAKPALSVQQKVLAFLSGAVARVRGDRPGRRQRR